MPKSVGLCRILSDAPAFHPGATSRPTNQTNPISREAAPKLTRRTQFPAGKAENVEKCRILSGAARTPSRAASRPKSQTNPTSREAAPRLTKRTQFPAGRAETSKSVGLCRIVSDAAFFLVALRNAAPAAPIPCYRTPAHLPGWFPGK
jgi:hypothetical protein